MLTSFTQFLINFWGNEIVLIGVLTDKTPVEKAHLFPVSCFLKTWVDGRIFLRQCKIGCLQYVLLKCLCATTTLFASYYDKFDSNDLFNPQSIYFWVVWIDNFSCFWALYALAIFYHTLGEELQPVKPFTKFLCVKMIVFFSFWQSLAIDILVKLKIITHTLTYSTEDVAEATQNWLICGEMLVASVLFTFAFSHRDFLRGNKKQIKQTIFLDDPENKNTSFFSAFLATSLPTDVLEDIRHLGPYSANNISTENTSLLNIDEQTTTSSV